MTDGANAVLENAASVAGSARTIADQAIAYAGKFNQLRIFLAILVSKS